MGDTGVIFHRNAGLKCAGGIAGCRIITESLLSAWRWHLSGGVTTAIPITHTGYLSMFSQISITLTLSQRWLYRDGQMGHAELALPMLVLVGVVLGELHRSCFSLILLAVLLNLVFILICVCLNSKYHVIHKDVWWLITRHTFKDEKH